MDFLIIENWETVRYLLGGLICILAVVCLIRQPKDFHATLAGELSGKKIDKIRKQVLKLKEESSKANKLLQSLDKTSFQVNTDDSIEVPQIDSLGVFSSQHLKSKASITRPFPKSQKSEEKEFHDPYENVRHYANTGMDKEYIFEKTNIPMAEIDLILKFHRLNRMSQLKNGMDHKIRAYG